MAHNFGLMKQFETLEDARQRWIAAERKLNQTSQDGNLRQGVARSKDSVLLWPIARYGACDQADRLRRIKPVALTFQACHEIVETFLK